jgi:hypothetical protein
MSTNAWLQYGSTSNKFIQSYVKGFVDISGGEFIVRNGNVYLPNNSIQDSALSSNVVFINGSNFSSLATFSGGLVVNGGATIDSLNVTYITIPYLNVSTTMTVPYINTVNITAASMNVASGTITALNVVNLVTTNLTLPYLNTTFATMGTLNATSGTFTSNIYVNSNTNQTLFMTVGNGLADVSTNTAIGVGVLGSTTTNATFNTASGYYCMNALTTGDNNTAMGSLAMQYNTVGNNNTAVGAQSSRYVLGNNNTSSGYSALGSLRYGNNNSAYGYLSLQNLSNVGNVAGVCNDNTAIGMESGEYDVSGSYNTYLGAYTGCVQNSSRVCQYSTAIGYGATIDSSNQIVVGRRTEKVYVPGIMSVGKYNFPSNVALDVSGNVNISGYLLYNLTSTTLTVTSLTTTSDSYINGVRIGEGPNDISTNTVFGYQALNSNTTGAFNSAMGYQAMFSNTDGSGNSAMGCFALRTNTTGSNNSAFGLQALEYNQTGSNNSAFGYTALRNNSAGSGNSGVGYSSLGSNTTGNNNTGVGLVSFNSNQTGSNNSGLGMRSGVNVIGSNNTCIGQSNGQLYASGVVINNSTAIGSNAYFDVSNQIVIGTSNERLYVPGSYLGIGKFVPASGYALDVSGSANISGTVATLYSVNTTSDSFINGARIGEGRGDISSNTVFGYNALATNTTGAFNSALGYEALYLNTDGSGNSAMGCFALRENTTGGNNSAMGFGALSRNTLGSNNSAMGWAAMSYNTIGNGNSAMGYAALNSNTSGSNNTVLGNSAGSNISTTSNNTCIGQASGVNVNGSNNTCIGQYNGQLSSGVVINNSTAIGSNAYFDVSNQIVIGTSNERLYVPGSYVGIGKFVVDPSYALDVSGNVNVSGSLSSLYTITSTKDSYVNSARIGLGNSDVSTNTAFGYQTLNSNTTRGTLNSAFGYQALLSNTDGSGNSAMGYQALRANTTGFNNSAMGGQALSANTIGSNNCALGSSSLTRNITGSGNSAVGQNALAYNIDGSNNSGMGIQALYYTTGSNNTALGSFSGTNNTTGSNNTFIGASANCPSGSTVSNSTAIGTGAITDVSNQIVIGRSTERVYIPGAYVGIGKFVPASGYALDVSGSANISGTVATLYSVNTTSDSFINGARIGEGRGDISSNTVFGFNALATNTTGAFNSALGYEALYLNTDGSANSAMGYQALRANTIGGNNSAFGHQVLLVNTTGSNNTGMGYRALPYNTLGSNNTACGFGTLNSNTIGSNNTALGHRAAYTMTTASNNTCIGFYSGYNVVGSNNTCIGQSNGQLFASGVVINNSTAIGSNAYFDVSNQIVIGTTSERLYVPGAYVGIGKFVPASGYALDVSGSANISGTVATVYSVNTTSDSFINGARIGEGRGDISSNTVFGFNALATNTTGAFNSALGYEALYLNTDGSANSAMGCQALRANTSGGNNTAMGFQVLVVNTLGSNNTGMGFRALPSNTIGNGNSAIGYASMNNNQTGSNNTAMGHVVLFNNVSGSNNSAIGAYSGSNVIGSNNTCIGQSNGQLYASGAVINNSTAIGSNAYFDVSNQIVIGTSSERLYVPGSYLGIGKFVPASGYALDVSGSANISGTVATVYSVNTTSDSFINGARIGEGRGDISSNTVFGFNALNANTTGRFNSALGYEALLLNTDGSANSAMGHQALRANTTGGNNSAFGARALLRNTLGSNNTAMGWSAMGNNTIGNGNSALGYMSLVSNTSGSNNTVLGNSAGSNISTTSNNTCIGQASGVNVNGSNNTCIGQYNGQLSSGVVINNSTAIGSNAYFDVSNQIVIGTTSERLYVPGAYVGIGKFIVDPSYSIDISGNVRISQGNLVVSGTGTSTAWNTWSDYRIKTNISPLTSSYVVDNLNPVSYTNKLSNKDEIGFIAHELQEHYPCLVNGEKDGDTYQSVNYSGLVPILTKEIKDIKSQLDIYEKTQCTGSASTSPIYGSVYQSCSGPCNGTLELPKGNWLVCYQSSFIVNSPTLLNSINIGLGDNPHDDPVYSVSKIHYNTPVEIKDNFVYSGKMIFSGETNPAVYLINKIVTSTNECITFDETNSYIKATMI